MVDTLGLPTVFFTHSTADLQWPELARPDSSLVYEARPFLALAGGRV